jgi:Dolichyl-phosphate-mannose-protein mannosyltransferase
LTKFDRTFRDQQTSEPSDLVAAAIVAAGFLWRIWLAHSTFFNTDEAWHFSVANQNSLAAAYRASLTLAHPPLLIFVLYFWKHFFSSDAMLRLPGVLAGTLFCWVFYKWLMVLFGRATAWCGLIFATFLPPMIVLSAELRQYSWMLLFAISAAYFLERAFIENSSRAMLLSSLCLWLAMLSHYSAFLFAASLGIYAIARMVVQRPPKTVIAMWSAGQAMGVALGAFLVKTHVSKLGSVYPGDPLRRFGDFYLADVYFHAGRESLTHFLYRGTFGVFRFLCAQRAAGHLTTVLFVAGIICLLFSARRDSTRSAQSRLLALLLVLPFFVNWIAVVAGLHPYGRTRQCVFLAIFGLTGVSYCLAKIAGNRICLAVSMAGAIVAVCHLFSTPHSLDMIVTAEQRHEHMDAAIAFIQSSLTPADVLFTDKPTSFQLLHYLCGPNPVGVHSSGDFDSFDCNGVRVISTNLDDGSLTPQSFPEKLRKLKDNYFVNSTPAIWVVQMAWSSGLGEALRRDYVFAEIEPHVFDRYIEVFRLPQHKRVDQVPSR